VETTAPLPVVAGPPRALGRLLDRWVPSAWRGAQLDPGRRGAAVIALVAAGAAVVAAVGVWSDRPIAEPAPPLTSVIAPAEPASPASAPPKASRAVPTGGPLVVSVVGKVRHPGLVSVPDGSRVADAIGKAGGPRSGVDLTTLNLARRLSDGEQIVVGLPRPAPEPEPVESGTPGDGHPAGGPIDLNRATAAQLDGLPGVGPVTAQRILDWRTKHGRFTSVDQLRVVPGIGERKFGQLKGLVTI
jgi:competence protein ComEA